MKDVKSYKADISNAIYQLTDDELISWLDTRPVEFTRLRYAIKAVEAIDEEIEAAEAQG